MSDRTTTDQEEILAFLATIGFPVPQGEGPLRMTISTDGEHSIYVSRDRAPGEPELPPFQILNRGKPA